MPRHSMTTTARKGPVEVIILAMPGTLPTTVAGPLDIFSQAGSLWNQFCERNPEAPFRVRLASEDGAPIACLNGLRLSADAALADIDRADLVIVTAANVADRAAWQARIAPALRRLHDGGAQVASICTGAFVLAEAGLLDGRAATTHWAFVPMFRSAYPQVDLRPERMLTHDGDILCSGGINAYAELCLYLVEHWCGHRTAEHLARALVLDGWRERQTPYAMFDFQKKHGDDAVLRAQRHMEERLAEPLNVAALAEVACMSERNFKRRFKKATGDTPNEYLQRLRVEGAKRLLERGGDGIDLVAERVGYRDVAHFRDVFRQIAGMTPADYRRRTRPRPAAA